MKKPISWLYLPESSSHTTYIFKTLEGKRDLAKKYDFQTLKHVFNWYFSLYFCKDKMHYESREMQVSRIKVGTKDRRQN